MFEVGPNSCRMPELYKHSQTWPTQGWPFGKNWSTITTSSLGIVVVLLCQSDRDQVLYLAKNLQGTTITIRTDLPLKFKKRGDCLPVRHIKSESKNNVNVNVNQVLLCTFRASCYTTYSTRLSWAHTINWAVCLGHSVSS